MPPALALLVWLLLLLALLYVERGRAREVSIALWVPVTWLLITASRLPSQWLGQELGQAAAAMEEGNALDRSVYLALIAASLSILVSRSFQWSRFFAANLVLVAVLLYSLASVAWSDFPAISLKRWIRDLGIYLAVLVVLSEHRPSRAIQETLRRLGIMLVPLSIVLIKYFPDLASQYDHWTGQKYYAGATTSKNMLGVLCLVSGLYLFWETLALWKRRRETPVQRSLIVNVALLAMTLWLLDKASSATSTLCLILGAVVIAVANLKSVRRRPRIIVALIPVAMVSYVLLQFVFDVDIVAAIAQMVGRHPDLTGRTHIWNVVLSAGTNALIGTGYEAFWLGPRLTWLWSRVGGINVAHNGYLEVYLTLGLVGLGLLATFLLVGYVRIAQRFSRGSAQGSLALALWTALLFYNVTESALRGNLMWIVFLLFVVLAPTRAVLRSPRQEASSDSPPFVSPSSPKPRGLRMGPMGRGTAAPR